MLTVDEPIALLPDQIANALTALVAYVDRDQRYRFVSRGYSERFQRPIEELRGMHVRDVIGESGYEAVRGHIEAALRGEEVYFEAHLSDAWGVRRRIEFRYAPHFGPAGEVLGYYTLVTDASEGEEQSRAESERDQRLQLAMDASGLGDWSWDMATDVVSGSDRAREIFGIPLGANATWAVMQDALHPDDRDAVFQALQHAIANNAPYEIEYRIRRPPDGENVWVSVKGRAQYAPDGSPVGILGVISDISRDKAVEAQLDAERERLADLERTQSFLLRLADALRLIQDPGVVMGTSAQMLGQFLNVKRVGYGEVDVAARELNVERDWSDGLASMAGRHAIPDFGEGAGVVLRAGRSLVVTDVNQDPRVDGEVFARIGVASTICTPLVKGGRARALLFVHDDRVRNWSQADVGVVEAVAERTWAALDRGRTEIALRESEARFRAMADSAPAPVWVSSDTGSIEFVNQAFIDYAGLPSEQMLGDAWVDLLHEDDLPDVAAARAHAWRSAAKPIPYEFEARFRRHDGAYRWMHTSSNPRFDSDGAFQGYVGMASDLTERRLAEAALRESEQRFRRVAEDAPVMLWMSDRAGHPVYLNRAMRQFWGLPDDITGFDWKQGVAEEDWPTLAQALVDAMRLSRVAEVEARHLRADGEVRTLLIRAEPRRDAEGRFVGVIGVNADVTDARRAETHQRLLINELNHRVKNTLATVQSIARQTLREGVGILDGRDLFSSRLLALSAAHNLLTRENWEGAELAELTAEAVRAYDDASASRIRCQGPGVRVEPRVALALSMALHELGTNAAKYGALSNAEGRIAIDWQVSEARDALTLEWRESGGPPVKAPTRRGFGSRLLGQGLAIDLGSAAETAYEPGGLVCVIRAKLKG